MDFWPDPCAERYMTVRRTVRHPVDRLSWIDGKTEICSHLTWFCKSILDVALEDFNAYYASDNR